LGKKNIRRQIVIFYKDKFSENPECPSPDRRENPFFRLFFLA
jgi:hypothetical protein